MSVDGDAFCIRAEHGTDPDLAIQSADLALYRAKSVLHGSSADRLTLEITESVPLPRSDSNLARLRRGVETAEQADDLTLEGCDHAQGYVFSRPVRPDRIPALAAQMRPVEPVLPEPQGD